MSINGISFTTGPAKRLLPLLTKPEVNERDRAQLPATLTKMCVIVSVRLAHTKAFQQSRRVRKKIEMRWCKKRILRSDRLRLRGLSGVRDELSLTATAPEATRQTSLPCLDTSGSNLPSVGAKMDGEAEIRESANKGPR
ncbi:hypothetical protein QWJ07_17100 [Frankia sp. RB7]|nr:hypothetical protein [Frankia sp. RB7]